MQTQNLKNLHNSVIHWWYNNTMYSLI